MVRPRSGAPGPGPAANGGAGRAAPPIQRDSAGTGGAAVSTGAPAKEVPVRDRTRSVSASSGPASSGPASPAPGRGAARYAETPQDPGLDLDDLARRLLDPMARLLRTELRRGRERTGRPHDGRR
ncbi:hypothetical protein F0L17_01100 [Streptomyces sp. TRM43335]|uniref:Syndecan 1 n=1 Tax=Streptomyces taklimakanensis TaxID=2569853 RepID=A0A6G2B672_9ACTN|nr:hypothetical protein [Streptomyces taklimakanensis]MTE17750.1 hypothetical protein [Streptomyces taklimakanensis]